MAGTRLKNYTRDELRAAVERGARCVTFNYCFSLIHTLHGETDIHVVESWTHALTRGAVYSLGTAVFGWWGLHGIFLTPVFLYLNLRGGNDYTAQVLASLESDALSACLVASPFTNVAETEVETARPPEDFLRQLERQRD